MHTCLSSSFIADIASRALTASSFSRQTSARRRETSSANTAGDRPSGIEEASTPLGIKVLSVDEPASPVSGETWPNWRETCSPSGIKVPSVDESPLSRGTWPNWREITSPSGIINKSASSSPRETWPNWREISKRETSSDETARRPIGEDTAGEKPLNGTRDSSLPARLASKRSRRPSASNLDKSRFCRASRNYKHRKRNRSVSLLLVSSL